MLMLAFSSNCRFAENSLTNLSNDTVRERKTDSLVGLLATYAHTKVTMMRGHKTRRSGVRYAQSSFLFELEGKCLCSCLDSPLFHFHNLIHARYLSMTQH